MKRFVGYLALLAGCYGPAFGIMAATPPHAPLADLVTYSCRVLERDCSHVAPPVIQWHEHIYIDQFGNEAYGVYDGTNVIHMSLSLLRTADPAFVSSVIAHESTHYYDVQLGVVTLPFTKDSVCASELNAWRVGNVYVMTHGRPDLADFGWAERYGCFR